MAPTNPPSEEQSNRSATEKSADAQEPVSQDEETQIRQDLEESTGGQRGNTDLTQTLDRDATTPLHRADHTAGLERLGDYELLEIIGRGGMGVVYKARQVSLDRTVALKMILAGQFASQDEVQRFHTEAQAAAHLDHAGIVPVFDVSEDDSRHFFSMGFIDGRSLSDRLRDGPLAPDEAARIVKVVAEAVQYAHEQGVIHRDLKPSNILLDHQQRPRVTDFGLAKRTESESDLTATGQILGTPSYMAPEQASGNIERVKESADVYALGAILYATLAGRAPFQSDNPIDTIQQVLNQAPVAPRQLNSKVPRDLETICLKCLQKDPNDRFSSAGEVADDLDRYLRGEPVQARPIGIFGRARRWVSRNRRVAALLTAVFVIAGIAVAAGVIATRFAESAKVAAIEKDFTDGLNHEDWSDDHLQNMDELIARMKKLSPESVAASEQRLTKAFGEHVRGLINQPRLADPGERTRIELALDRLSHRDSGLANQLRQAYQDRLTRKATVFKWEAPGEDPRTVFDAPNIHIEDQQLVRRTPKKEAEVVLTKERSRGNVTFEVEFGEGWDEATRMGLVFGKGSEFGYQFIVGAVDDKTRKKAPPTIAAIRAMNGYVPVTILRDGKTLLENLVAARNLPARRLHLTAAREGDQLTFQVGGKMKLDVFDYFPIPSAHQGNFGVVWPARAKVRWMLATRQVLPPVPSPLEEGDRLYAEGAYSQALAKYREQADELADSPSGQIARYKQGACLVSLNRWKEAVEILRPIAQSQGPVLPDAAACQLLRLHLLEKRYDEATSLLERLIFRRLLDSKGGPSSRSSLATVMPMDVVGMTRRFLSSHGSGIAYWRFDPDMVRKQQLLVEFDRQLEMPIEYRVYAEQQLVRAYRAAGRRNEAREVAERFLNEFPRDASRLEQKITVGAVMLVEEYCWLLRISGKAEEAFDKLNERLVDANGKYRPHMIRLLIERARIHAALDRWELAEDDLNAYLELQPTAPPDYRAQSDAYLMLGFIRQRSGAADAAEVWSKGMIPPDPKKGVLGHMGGTISILNHFMAGGLSGKLSDQDIDTLLTKFLAQRLRVSRTKAGIMKQMGQLAGVHPAMFRDMWLSERGRRCAEQWVFRSVSLPETIRFPAVLFVNELVSDSAFRDTTSEEKDLLWETLNELYDFVSAGKVPLDPGLFGTAAVTWAGQNDWANLSQRLSDAPALRGKVAYLLGKRYVRLGKPDDAAALFKQAIANAPNEVLLVRLANAELNRLDSE